MKAHPPILWFSVRKNRKRKTFNIAWGHSHELNGWDLLMWSRTCQEFRLHDRIVALFDYHVERLPGDFDLVSVTPAVEAAECSHCPEDLVEKVREMVLEAQNHFLRTYYVGAHND